MKPCTVRLLDIFVKAPCILLIISAGFLFELMVELPFLVLLWFLGKRTGNPEASGKR